MRGYVMGRTDEAEVLTGFRNCNKGDRKIGL